MLARVGQRMGSPWSSVSMMMSASCRHSRVLEIRVQGPFWP